MERRAHWSDDLIDAVRDAVDVEFDGIWKLSEDSIRAVIAAVEDWARWEHVPKGTLARLEQAEATIQRMRELHVPHVCDMATSHINCSIVHGGACRNVGHCAECGRPYPCPTMLDGERDE